MYNSLKRATALMAVVLMLTGCSSQDNKSNNHSTDDARLEPVEQAYDGCDKLLGSDHGSFKLPEKISKVDFEKVYSLSCNTLKNDDMTNAEKLFKTFYGDDFDESALSTDTSCASCLTILVCSYFTIDNKHLIRRTFSVA